MSDVTQILSEIEGGDPAAAEKLLPLVYDALRQLAVAKLANEKPGQTLHATALVHEAYSGWWTRRRPILEQPGPFFRGGRRIDAANPGGERPSQEAGRPRRRPARVRLDAVELAADAPSKDLLALDESLRRLEETTRRRPYLSSSDTLPE